MLLVELGSSFSFKVSAACPSFVWRILKGKKKRKKKENGSKVVDDEWDLLCVNWLLFLDDMLILQPQEKWQDYFVFIYDHCACFTSTLIHTQSHSLTTWNTGSVNVSSCLTPFVNEVFYIWCDYCTLFFLFFPWGLRFWLNAPRLFLGLFGITFQILRTS